MNNTFYTYLLIDSRTNLPFYIGKGNGKRMYLHVQKTLRRKFIDRNLYKYNKIWNIYNNNGKVVYKKVVQNVSEDIALKFEILLIKYYGRNNLCNLTDGGEGSTGFVFSKESRRKLSISTKKRFQKNNWDAKHRKQISDRMKGNKNLLGYKFSEESKKKISIAVKNIKRSQETKDKHKKENLSLETRRRLSEGHKGFKHSEETKRKMSLALIGNKRMVGKIPWNKGLSMKNYKKVL